MIKLRQSPVYCLLFMSGLLIAVSQSLWAGGPTTAILVDKKTNQLHVTQYIEGHYQILKTYHATLGKVRGDKEDRDDLKTPEGIYQFTTILKPPSLPKKFGMMSFVMNFPNAFDQLAGRTGSGIMLHATNEPDRLKKNYDSEGCIVVKDEEIQEIQPYIQLGLTPILVFAELTPNDLNLGPNANLKTFFDAWVQGWETKNLEQYIDSYHTEFSASGKSRDAWKAYKAGLNSRYASIEIHPEMIHYYRHPKYSVVTFTQNYRSRLQGGGWGHRSRGTKILYVAEEAGHPKIIAETFSQLMW